MIATLRYEFLMQIRRPSLWIVYGLVFVVLAVTLPYATLDMGLSDLPPDPTAQDIAVARLFDLDDPGVAMSELARLLVTLLPLVYGCMIADRPGRDRRLHVGEVLDTLPAGRTRRLVGKYAGVCLATAVPYALVYFGRAVAYAVTEGNPSAVATAAAVFLVSIAPGLAFVGGIAFAGPLLVAPAVFRVLFVVYWFWAVIIPESMMPTLSRTILSPAGEYGRYGLFMEDPAVYFAQFPDAFDFLRPVGSPALAALWVAVMVALTAVALFLVRLHAVRSES